MKATMSVDGVERITLRVEYRLDKASMVTLLATHASTYGDAGEKITTAKALEMIKTQLMYSGTDVLDFGSDTDIEGALEWAQELVDRIWK